MIGKLKISTKLWFFTGFSFSMVLLLFFFFLFQIGAIKKIYSHIQTISRIQLELKQREIDHLNWANAVSEFLTDQSLKTFTVEKDFHKCGFGEWFYGVGKKESLHHMPEIKDIITALEIPHSDLHKSVQELEDILNSGDYTFVKGQDYFKQSTMVHLVKVQDLLGKSVKLADTAKMQSENIVIKKERYIQNMSIFCGILFLLLIILFGFLLSRSILSPLQNTISMLKNIAIGDGDLSKRLPMREVNCSAIKKCGHTICPEYGKESTCWDTVGSNAPGQIHCPSILSGKLSSCNDCPVMQGVIITETDELSGWFNTFIGRISQLIKLNKDSISQLIHVSERQSSSTAQISSSTEEMNSQSTTIASAAEQASVNMTTVAQNTESMSSSIATFAAAIDEMSSTANEISKSCQKESDIALLADKKAKSANEMIGKLEGSASEIGKVLEVIKDIADQTNLLALNATIEAASAGEAGKGFAVVANEVKELAKQTAQATDEIGKQVEGIRTNTSSSVSAINEITTVIEEVNMVSQTIVSAVEEQSATINEIAKNVNSVNQSSTEVSTNIDETAKGIGEIALNIGGFNQTISEIAHGIDQVDKSSTELTAMATTLGGSVDQFKI